MVFSQPSPVQPPCRVRLTLDLAIDPTKRAEWPVNFLDMLARIAEAGATYEIQQRTGDGEVTVLSSTMTPLP